MIKLRFGKKSIYLLITYISWYLRKVIAILIQYIYTFNISYLYLYLMTLGQIAGGLSIYLYRYKSFRKNKDSKYFGRELIYNINSLKPADGQFKIILLIFFASIFDIVEFLISIFYIPIIDSKISPTINSRLGCLSFISSALICTYALKFRIGRHHKISLILLGLCFCLMMALEIIYKPENISYEKFLYAHLLVCCYLLFISFTDCTERYLTEFNFLDPFKIIMFEGIIEFIIAILYSINKDPFKEIINYNENPNHGSVIFLIILLILYFLLSAVANIYKIFCNAIYAPMDKALVDYFLNPILNIFYFIVAGDFQKNLIFFFICEIICIMMNFFSFIYNEYLILFCFNLSYDTKDEISKRAKEIEMNVSIHSLKAAEFNDNRTSLFSEVVDNLSGE